MLSFPKNERAIAAKLLKMAADEFSNHGCNDIDELFINLTEYEKNLLEKEINEYIVKDPNNPIKLNQVPDWMLMLFYAFKLEQI